MILIAREGKQSRKEAGGSRQQAQQSRKEAGGSKQQALISSSLEELPEIRA